VVNDRNRELLIRREYRSKFHRDFVAARSELTEIKKQQMEMGAQEFWERIDSFYHSYPLVIMEALELALIESSLREQGRLTKYPSN
jgi:hypothetical protein